MRALLPILLASSSLSVLGLAVACGSSPTSNNSAASGTDASPMPESGSGSSSGGQSDGSSPHDAGTSDAGDGGACPAVGTGSFSPAAHGPLPTMAYYGGPVLRSPLVVTFTFQDTPNAAALDSFGATVASTSWFTEVTKDYCIPDGGACISAGPPGKAVPIAANADATYVDTGGMGGDGGAGTDLNQFMNQQIAAAVTAGTIPAPDGNAVYMFYFPPTTTITGIVGTSCTDYGAYHDNQTYSDGTTTIAYAIVPDCASTSANALNSVTVAASHELAEATTDPTPSSTTPAWYMDVSSYPEGGTTQPQYRNDPWLTQGYGEVGDNCESVHSKNWSLMGDAGPFVQRIWSTSAAADGHDPCVPVPAALGPYFNASTDKAMYVANVGDTFTVDVSPFSDAQRASWQLDALDYTPGQYAGMNHYLKFEFVGGALRSDGVAAMTCVNNGAQVQLKVTLLADPASDTSLGQQPSEEWPEAVGAVSSVDESQTVPVVPTRQQNSHFWVFSVVTPATAAMIGVPSTGISDMVRRRHHARSPRLTLEP